MSGMFDKVKNIYPGKQTWRFKVRVIPVWNMCLISDPDKPFAMDMVLIDVEGSKIQAMIRKSMLWKFNDCVKEGDVYAMTFFAMVANTGSYRATRHEYKLLFHAKTTVIPCDDITIPMNGFSLMNSMEVKETNGACDYLVDVMGVLTVISAEIVSLKDGKTTRLIQMEMIDEK
ncbi:Replication protein A 70 kDa DNA-binding subunit C [Spatholobus suberectus]|nr:Replication protein A 70 kDa DNA-binding subunit C [Spatholobus suberectus]